MNNKTIYRKQCKRWDFPGNAHFLTFSCYQRRPFLNHDKTRLWFLSALEQSKRIHDFHLWAYVIMPEHVHLVIWPGKAKISPILKSIKLPVARRAVLWVKQNQPDYLKRMEDTQPNGKTVYRFWQRGGGYDRNLRGSRDIHEKIQYVHKNPLRRQLVSDLSRWPWSSWSNHCMKGNHHVQLNLESLPPDMGSY